MTVGWTNLHSPVIHPSSRRQGDGIRSNRVHRQASGKFRVRLSPGISMQIVGIQFPESLCDALRDRRLVIFAGAGVSMGEPACLPNFKQLACAIANGTGQSFQESRETEDRFLGRLRHRGVDVHHRAAQELFRDDLQPTDLHRSLLRLCSVPSIAPVKHPELADLHQGLPRVCSNRVNPMR